jgi:hypothetical protein
MIDRRTVAEAPTALPGAIAALDPGRSKCGLVRTDDQRLQLVSAAVLSPEAALARLRQWQAEAPVTLLLLGAGTGSAHWRTSLQGLVDVQLIEEGGTTLAARRRYWQLMPPRGWRRMLPQGLRQPPRDWDDVVAQVLLERWLGRELPRLGC